MARTALKWVLGGILTIIGFFVVGVVLVGYLNYLAGSGSYTNTEGGLISGIIIGSIGFIPGVILLILALIDVVNNSFDLRISRILQEFDRITPKDLAQKANSNEDRIEKSVSRIIEKGLIIVFFDSATGEFVTQEGRAIANRVIGIINSKRRITLEELSEETGLSYDEIKRIVVGMEKRGLFDGKYDWRSGKILSSEAVQLLATAKTDCTYCGARLPEPPLRGEEIQCRYCGKIVIG